MSVNQVQLYTTGLCGQGRCEGSLNSIRCRGAVLFTLNLLVECACPCHGIAAYMRHVASMPPVLLWGIPMYVEADHYSPVALCPTPTPESWGHPVVVQVESATPAVGEAWSPLTVLADSRRGKAKDAPRRIPAEVLAIIKLDLPSGLDGPPANLLVAPRVQSSSVPTQRDESTEPRTTRSDIRDIAEEFLTREVVQFWTDLPVGGVQMNLIRRYFIEKYGYEVSPGALENQLKVLAAQGKFKLIAGPVRVAAI